LFFRQVAEGYHTFYATGATILFRSCDATFVTKFETIKRVFPVSHRHTVYGHPGTTREEKGYGI
jgi:hypothetical protein